MEGAMSARHWSMALVFALAALPAAAETAKARGGSSGGHSVGSAHQSSSPSHAAPPHAVPRGTGSSAASGPESRHPRAGTGHGYAHGGYYHGGYYPYYPYYSPYYAYGYGYPYFGLTFGYGSPYYYGPYGGGYYDGHSGDYGSVRVLVDPNEAQVFVDGSYAGTADDFDGLFQRLHVAPGRHELTFKLEGYQTHRVRLYVPYDGTVKVHYDMVRGTGEDAFEDLAGDRPDDDRHAEPRDRDDRFAYDAPRSDDGANRPARDERGSTLRFDVAPDGSSIYVDGVFRGTGRTLHTLDVAPGAHRVEILHPGLRSFERDVTVDDGESQDVSVELTR